MTFKAIAAALTLLLMLVGSLHTGAASATRAAAAMEQRRSFELGVAEPDALREPGHAHGHGAAPESLQNATVFNGVFDAARHAGRTARSHVPEPKVLLLLGLALLLFGLRRGGKPSRNSPRR